MNKGEETALVPILVEGSGRDGTTLAMQLLGTSPEVAFDRNYPYEQRYLTYLFHWSCVPELEEWDLAGWNLDTLAHPQLLTGIGSIGPIPWPERSLIAGPEPLSHELFAMAWSQFSRRAREATRAQLGDADLEVRFYAQKSAETWAIPFDRLPLPGPRIVCMLRDPRDTWQSSVAFHERRQARGDSFLPVEHDEPGDAYLGTFLEDQKNRLQWLRKKGAEENAGIQVVHYESLVADLPAEATRLGEWLGLSLDAEAVRRRRQSFAGHITAASPEQSVGRWKREMPDDLAARFWDELGAELAEFGYEA